MLVSCSTPSKGLDVLTCRGVYNTDSVPSVFTRVDPIQIVSTGAKEKIDFSNFLICQLDLDKICKIDGPHCCRDFVRFLQVKSSPNSPKRGFQDFENRK